MTRPRQPHAPFRSRHCEAPSPHLLATLGVDSLEDLGEAVIPEGLPRWSSSTPPRVCGQLGASALSGGFSEAEVAKAMRKAAALNDPHVEMIGRGYHPTHTPAVLIRDILSNPAWATSYTPYQAEISQGRLEAQLLFQTLISDLTELPVAAASLLDEATAVGEAVLLMARAARAKTGRVLMDPDLHPQILEVATARLAALSLTWTLASPAQIADAEWPGWHEEAPVLGAVLAQVASTGEVRDPGMLSGAVGAVHAHGGLVAVDCDPLALTLLETPGTLGADIAVGSAQRLGVPLFFGGPHPGFMAVAEKLTRQIPGRIVGVSMDSEGNQAYRLALQTREQHIRREKATSNICTAQALLAVVAAMFAVYHGPEGLRAIAEHTRDMARLLASGLTAGGLDVRTPHIFDTVCVRLDDAAGAVERAAAAGYNLRLLNENHLAISTNETTTLAHVIDVVEVLAGAAAAQKVAHAADHDAEQLAGAWPVTWERRSEFLTHPSFHAYRSEQALVRYLRRLADRDLALDRSMIPLGSCTLKLNAAVESAAWLEPGLAGIHPYAPSSQTRGWRILLGELSDRLVRLTGYDRISLQPASGAQGELTGLLAIRGYLDDCGQRERTVVLVPASAHGTNAASAAAAGMSVMVVGTAPDGSIDLDHLRALLAEHGERVAALMLTYPSTHGVFEPHVTEVTRLVHEAGGQVYIDGANLNALTGLVRPGDLGGDCSHLNLHKTFAIPHGGGGPGVGPVAVKEHLAPYLPRRPEGASDPLPEDPDTGLSGAPVMGAPFGSAGVMPLSWAYLALLDDEDLRTVSLTAIAKANYLSRELEEFFPTLYTHDGWVAHECILDLRGLTHDTGVTAEDVAKRLIDYGFHAPTLAFPVPGTLMVEPTESEPQEELDRFTHAMRAIRGEIEEVASGAVGLEDSVLRLAPHTAAQVAGDTWERVYSRSQAAFPLPGMEADKYFPPVSRINNAWGDRNLMCTCPAPSAFDENTPA